jgi:riboflavin biosynthesis pyrimidine reductase
VTAEAQRQLILHMSVSLDGFVARRDGVIDWLSSQSAGDVDMATIAITPPSR